MANPQLGEGYTAISNELMEAFARTKFTQAEYKTLFAFLRKTYGWHKKKDCIPITQFCKMTLLRHHKQVRALNGLVTKRVLVKEKVVTRWGLANCFSLQKDWIKWTSYPTGTSEDPDFKLTSPLSASNPVPLRGLSKTTLSKDTLSAKDPAAVKKDIDEKVQALAEKKGFTGPHPWQEMAIRAWKRMGQGDSPPASFFKCFKEHETRAEAVAGEVSELHPQNPEAYFYKLLSIRLKGINVAK